MIRTKKNSDSDSDKKKMDEVLQRMLNTPPPKPAKKEKPA